MKLVFIPQSQVYRMGLLNQSDTEYVFTLQVKIGGNVFLNDTGIVQAYGYYDSCRLYRDIIYDHPIFELDCQEQFTSGRGQTFQYIATLKSRHFIKAMTYEEPVGTEAYIIQFKPRRLMAPVLNIVQKPKDLKGPQSIKSYDFSFNYVIDLHAKSLGIKETDKKNILTTQLGAFKAWFQKAIIVGHSPLFVIHGVGTGVLKDRLHDILANAPAVRHYINEYHPQYGYGATEIILK